MYVADVKQYIDMLIRLGYKQGKFKRVKFENGILYYDPKVDSDKGIALLWSLYINMTGEVIEEFKYE